MYFFKTGYKRPRTHTTINNQIHCNQSAIENCVLMFPNLPRRKGRRIHMGAEQPTLASLVLTW
jgi:hypothetical protein